MIYVPQALEKNVYNAFVGWSVLLSVDYILLVDGVVEFFSILVDLV